VAPVTLNANATYYILSQETAGGDRWYDSDTTAQTMNIAALNFPVFVPNGGPYTPVASLPGHLYGPVDFSISIGISVTPATVTLSDGQTQQFTATVSGSNQAVTWSISPASIGSISASGLYTAPSPVPAAQTVTVTATSVADPTKSATATVSLSLPGPPSITQQPQSIGVFVGQQATFSVTAGGGVTYQWQSKSGGATGFTNIAGATSSSYTTPVATLSYSGTQFQCVVTNRIGTLTSNPATLTVLTIGTNFVVKPSPGTLRNNFSGWVGMSITVGPNPLVVSSLGRYVASGNTAVHSLKLVDGTANADIAGAVTSINTASATANAFVYGLLPSPVTLNPNATYYIVSQEVTGGDQWYDYLTTTATTTADATLSGAAYGTGAPYSLAYNSAGELFGPVDFQYVALTVSPATATLTVNQTQQFSAVGVGIGNTATWSISPSTTGSISTTGVYSAPAAIATQQTVTVTASSTLNPNLTGTATVTLNPPAGIAQQPQNTSVFIGETAAFSLTANGVGVTYQWQSMVSGATAFTNISGANASSYTTPPAVLVNGGTQYRCIVAISGQNFTSNAATLTVLSPGSTFITSKALGTPRNNYTGWQGMSITVGAKPLVVTGLGRLAAPGNSASHTLKLVDAVAGVDIQGGSTSVNMSGASSGSFVYGALPSPITLNANATYYLVSQETQGGDQWYDVDTVAGTTSDATLAAAVRGGPPYAPVSNTAGHPYGP
ncbi:MAG: Ig-like domain-containing protein, partial [Acidobacteriia bacterium]|nr:Ig-like domain-containing protein [Terriglobia bacterium]